MNLPPIIKSSSSVKFLYLTLNGKPIHRLDTLVNWLYEVRLPRSFYLIRSRASGYCRGQTPLGDIGAATARPPTNPHRDARGCREEKERPFWNQIGQVPDYGESAIDSLDLTYWFRHGELVPEVFESDHDIEKMWAASPYDWSLALQGLL